MRFKTLSTLLLGGVLAVTLAGCSGGGDEAPPTPKALEGQISLSDTLKVSYDSAELAPASDVPKLKELNPEVGAFDQGYVPIYLKMDIASTESKDEILKQLNENVFAIAADSAQVGALPVTEGTACDGGILTGSEAEGYTYCKIVLLEPEKDPSLVGIASFDSKDIFNKPLGEEDASATPSPEPTE